MKNAYTKAVADLCNNQGGEICGALIRLPDARQATVDDHGCVHVWEASEDGRLVLTDLKPFAGVSK